MSFPNYTKEEIIDNIYGNTIRCQHCEYQDFYAYRTNPDTYKTKCKRIDHDIVRFTPNVFSGHATDLMHPICSDFKPNKLYKLLYENWTCFDDYKEYYKSVNGEEIRGLNQYDYFSFVIKGCDKYRFHVKGSNFVYGTMFDKDGKLKAYERISQKIVRNPEPERIKNFYPYRLIREEINGVNPNYFSLTGESL